jgi:hypothetical protein
LANLRSFFEIVEGKNDAFPPLFRLSDQPRKFAKVSALNVDVITGGEPMRKELKPGLGRELICPALARIANRHDFGNREVGDEGIQICRTILK